MPVVGGRLFFLRPQSVVDSSSRVSVMAIGLVFGSRQQEGKPVRRNASTHQFDGLAGALQYPVFQSHSYTIGGVPPLHLRRGKEKNQAEI